ncbi:aldose 1-epimerase-like [Dorcoceras hygrometricum]|uniref:Aldose 1-epimerase-like n=1 Tax=Dorcoceras hygrometricum TaxID=472368 RepID=A0A2Z7A5X8_9LAMI|nr:aldose 1-epimerase-like [Dorcoceras hygrometricum]
MVVDSIGIYELKGPYYTLTMTDWFLQALSVIPRGSWDDVARRFTMAPSSDQFHEETGTSNGCEGERRYRTLISLLGS